MNTRRLNIGIRTRIERTRSLREAVRRAAHDGRKRQGTELYFENVDELRRVWYCPNLKSWVKTPTLTDMPKSEVQLACELIRILDGLSIKDARDALARADTILLSTQIVRADSSLLAVTSENEATFSR